MIGIDSIASYLPRVVRNNSDLPPHFSFERHFLEYKLGIMHRHAAQPDETVSMMATAAAREAIVRSNITPSELGLLILCTQTPDFRLPTTANLVQAQLGLSSEIIAFDINQGCSGYIHSLAVAKSLMEMQSIRAGLVLTSDVYTHIVDPNDRDTAPIFGDAATATLLTAGGKGAIGRCSFGSDGTGWSNLVLANGGSRQPRLDGTRDDYLRMNGRAVFNFVMDRIPKDVDRCLTANNIHKDGIDFFVFHQASRYLVETLAGRLEIPTEKVIISLHDTGNTVSSSIPLALQGLLDSASVSGKRILLCGFGVGYSWGSTIATFR